MHASSERRVVPSLTPYVALVHNVALELNVALTLGVAWFDVNSSHCIKSNLNGQVGA